jgi:hypothetical protein
MGVSGQSDPVSWLFVGFDYCSEKTCYVELRRAQTGGAVVVGRMEIPIYELESMVDSAHSFLSLYYCGLLGPHMEREDD